MTNSMGRRQPPRFLGPGDATTPDYVELFPIGCCVSLSAPTNRRIGYARLRRNRLHNR